MNFLNIFKLAFSLIQFNPHWFFYLVCVLLLNFYIWWLRPQTLVMKMNWSSLGRQLILLWSFATLFLPSDFFTLFYLNFNHLYCICISVLFLFIVFYIVWFSFQNLCSLLFQVEANFINWSHQAVDFILGNDVLYLFILILNFLSLVRLGWFGDEGNSMYARTCRSWCYNAIHKVRGKMNRCL